jgi:hypothetical protein
MLETTKSGDREAFRTAIAQVAAEFQTAPFQFGNEHPVSADLYATIRSIIPDEWISGEFRFDYAEYKGNADEWRIEQLRDFAGDTHPVSDPEVRRVRSETGFAGRPLGEPAQGDGVEENDPIMPYTFDVPESQKDSDEETPKARFKQVEDGRSAISKFDIVLFEQDPEDLYLQAKAEGPGELFELPAPISVICEIKHSKNTASSALYGSSGAAEDVSRLSKLPTDGETYRVMVLVDWWPRNGDGHWRYDKTNKFSDGYLGELEDNARELGLDNPVKVVYIPRFSKPGEIDERRVASDIFSRATVHRPEVGEGLDSPLLVTYTIRREGPGDG